MDAKKCDRCGGFYNVIPGTKDYYINKRFELSSWKKLDLCPVCNNDLSMFMELTDMVPVYCKSKEEEEFGVE